jgi:hypothetical protein
MALMENGIRGPGGRRELLIGSHARHGRRAEAQIPVGLERLLLMAAADPDLRARLQRDPRAACAGLGFELAASERALLGALTPAALDAMIEGLAPKRQKNQRFLRKVGAAALVGGILVASCDGGNDTAASGGVDPSSDADSDADAGPDAGE